MKEWLSEFKYRQEREEWMDRPETPRSELVRALAEIRWVNRHLGGTSAILNEVKKIRPQNSILKILDLGTGSADIPRALVDWARIRNIPIQVTAVDLNPVVTEEAKRLSLSYPEIEIIEGNALSLPYSEGSYDFVISSMFMHHLTEPEAVTLLKAMAHLCRLGFAVNDLERHPCAWLGIKLLGLFTGKGELFMNDAPLSVLKGFSFEDMRHICEKAELPDCSIKKRHPFRLVITWAKD